METDALELVRTALTEALLISLPILGAGLVIGLLISLFQAVTQIQEQTLAFVPKLVAVGAIFLVALPWMLQLAVRYTTELFRSIPTMAG